MKKRFGAERKAAPDHFLGLSYKMIWKLEGEKNMLPFKCHIFLSKKRPSNRAIAEGVEIASSQYFLLCF